MTDFTPLRLGRQWKEGVAAKLEVGWGLLMHAMRLHLARWHAMVCLWSCLSCVPNCLRHAMLCSAMRCCTDALV